MQPRLPDDLELHTLALDREGRARDVDTGRRLGDPGAHVRRVIEHLEAAPVRDGVRRVLLHVHGGLNSSREGRRQARAIFESMAAESDPSEQHHPIFVTWDSGGPSAYLEHLLRFRQGRASRVWGRITAPIWLVTDMVLGLARLLRTFTWQVVQDSALAARVGLGWTLLPAWSNAEAIHRVASGSENGYHSTIGDYRRGALVQAGRLVLYYATLPVKLVSQWAFLDGLGPGAWSVLRHRVHALFRKPEEFDVRDLREDDEALERHLEGDTPTDLVLLLRGLRGACERAAEEASGARAEPESAAPIELVLVGHSMGATILNAALAYMHAPSVVRLCHLAPACSIRDALQQVVPFLVENPHTRLEISTLHPCAEADEINLGDLVPRGSLLQWIDHGYTTPASHLDRRLGGWINLMQALHLFRPVRSQLRVHAFGVAPGSKPQRHSDFQRIPFWRSTLLDADSGVSTTPPG